MISPVSLLLIGLATFLFYFLVLRKSKWQKVPPGPRGLPILGNMLQIDKLQYPTFSKWADEYGPFYKVAFGPMEMIMISDYKMLKQIFSETAFSGRLITPEFDWILDGNLHGLVNTEGPHWEELRPFVLRQLRDFGFGKNSMEESIMVEVQELIEALKKEEGKPMSNVKERFLLAVLNSLWFVTSGKRFKQDDQALIDFSAKLMDAFNGIFESGSVAFIFPGLAKMFPKLTHYDKVVDAFHHFTSYFQKSIDEHKATITEDYDRDLIDVFLKQIQRTTDPGSAFYGRMGENHLIGTLADLYFAGSDTTSTTLAWLILYLSKMPEIQQKLQNEIEAVTGNTRPCSVADRPNMPYTEAVLAEVSRFASILPIGVQHRAIQDKEFNGYLIPKGVVICANSYYIHHDPKIWGDPETFRPERFISPDGKSFKKHEALMPFSIGRRQCLGETLARDSLFLFTTNIFQRFSIEFDKNGPDNGWKSKVSFILAPESYNVIFKDRLVQ